MASTLSAVKKLSFLHHFIWILIADPVPMSRQCLANVTASQEPASLSDAVDSVSHVAASVAGEGHSVSTEPEQLVSVAELGCVLRRCIPDVQVQLRLSV